MCWILWDSYFSDRNFGILQILILSATIEVQALNLFFKVKEGVRAAWPNQFQFLCANISYAVGLGNIWRWVYETGLFANKSVENGSMPSNKNTFVHGSFTTRKKHLRSFTMILYITRIWKLKNRTLFRNRKVSTISMCRVIFQN